MASNTNESQLSQGIQALVRNFVLTPVVQYLATRQPIQGPVTVDELANVLRLQANISTPALVAPPGFAPNPMQPMGALPVPAMANIFGMPGMMTGPTGKKGGKNAAPVAEGERCIYTFTRGEKAGQQCGAHVVPGTSFCSACSNKKAAKSQGAAPGGLPAVGGMAPFGMPNMTQQLGQQLPLFSKRPRRSDPCDLAG